MLFTDKSRNVRRGCDFAATEVGVWILIVSGAKLLLVNLRN